MEARQAEIESGKLVVVFLEECHPNVALNYSTGKCLVKAYAQGNSQSTIEFLQDRQQQYPRQRFAIFWDGASYHRAAQLKAYLQMVNQDLFEDVWLCA